MLKAQCAFELIVRDNISQTKRSTLYSSIPVRQGWPTRDLLDSKAPMLAGSDWPSAVPDMNPWGGIEALVSRSDPFARYPGTIWQEQALTISVYRVSLMMVPVHCLQGLIQASLMWHQCVFNAV